MRAHSWIGAWLLVAAVSLTAGRAIAGEPVRILIAVGNDTGVGADAALQFAARDATRVARVLRTLGGIPLERVRLVTNAEPEGLLDALRWAAALAERHDPADVTLFVYYSGHGSADALHMAGEQLPLARLARRIAGVRAGLRITIIDACRTGRGKGLTPDATFEISLRAPAGPSGAVTLRSSSPGEAAQESDALQGAVFTHFLLSGLRGAADSDSDARVTLAEAYAYAYDRTLRRSAQGAAVQHPEAAVDVQGAGPVVLTHTSRGRAVLELPVEADVHYLVYRLPAGAVIAEVWGSAERAVSVALPAGRLLVQRRGQGRYGAAELALPYGGRRVLESDEFEAVPYDELARKGGHLLLRRSELEVEYGFMVGARAELGHRVALRYGFRWPWVTLGVGLELARVERTGNAHDIEEQWAGGHGQDDGRFDLGRVALAVGGGVALRWIGQRLRRLDAPRLEGGPYALEEERSALGAGPMLAVAMRVPFGGRWWWTLGAEVTGVAVKEGDELSFRLDGAVRSGFGVEF